MAAGKDTEGRSASILHRSLPSPQQKAPAKYLFLNSDLSYTIVYKRLILPLEVPRSPTHDRLSRPPFRGLPSACRESYRNYGTRSEVPPPPAAPIARADQAGWKPSCNVLRVRSSSPPRTLMSETSDLPPMSPKIADFREHAFVQQMLPAHSRLLAKCATERVIPKGQLPETAGRPGRRDLPDPAPGPSRWRSLCLTRAPSASRPFAPGASWAGLASCRPTRWRFDARTLSDVGVFAIKTESLRRKCDHDHDFGYSILLRCAPVIAERLQADANQAP